MSSESPCHPFSVKTRQPVSSLEIEFIIREIGDRLEAAVGVIDKLQRERYDAESNYSEAFETAKTALSLVEAT